MAGVRGCTLGAENFFQREGAGVLCVFGALF